MSLASLLAASATLWLLLHFVFVPRTERRVRLGLGAEGSIAAVVALATLQTLRTVCLFMAVSSMAVLSYVWWLSWWDGDSVDALARSLASLRGLRGQIQGFSWWWTMFVSCGLALMLLWLVRRSARAKATFAIRERIERQLQELYQQKLDGELPQLADTADMQLVAKERMASLEQLQAIEAGESFKIESDDEVFLVDPDELEPEAIQALMQDLSERVHALENLHEQLDMNRRIDIDEVRPDPDQWASPPARGWLGKLGGVFASRGTLSGMSGISRFTFVLSLLLLVPSTTAIAAKTGEAALERRIVESNRLYIELSGPAAEATWNQAISVSPQPEALNEEDKRAVEEMAEAYEQKVIERMSGRTVQHTTAHAVRRAMLRQRILKSSRLSHSVQIVEPTENVGRQFADATDMLASPDRPGPRTEVGRRMREDLAELVRRQPREWRDSFRRSVAGLNKPATVDDVTRAMLGNVFAQAGEPGLAVADIAKKMGDIDLQGPELHTRRQVLSKLVVAPDSQVALDAAVPELSWVESDLSKFRGVADRNVPSPNKLQQHLDDRPPALAVLDEEHVNAPRARKIAEGIARRRGGLGAVDALSGFADYFPHALGRTPNTAPKPTVSGGPSPNVSRRAAIRARSFSRLRGFSRVGGVLIGRPPANPKAVSLSRFDWTLEGDQLWFTLGIDGATQKLGPFRPRIASSALAYAADGRPVAVTMTSAEPLRELRVLLHPALVDTALGCRAIEIDRFVAIFARSEKGPLGDSDVARRLKAAQLRLQAANTLYQIAWLARERTPLYQRSPRQDLRTRQLGKQLSAVALRPFASNWKMLLDPQVSPLKAKPEFFDQRLVRALERCAEEGVDARRVFGCVKKKVTVSTRFTFPPMFQVWAGVREKEFAIDRGMEFLRDDGEPLGPFNFILQVAFISPPEFLPVSRKVEDYFDEDPWQFPAEATLINGAVSSGVQKSPQHAEVLRDMAEFTLLQRLFRAMLDDSLAPLEVAEQLGPLANALGETPPVRSRTLRWDPRPGDLEVTVLREVTSVLSNLRSGDSCGAACDAVASALETCTALAPDVDAEARISNARRIELASLTADEWQVCRFERLSTSPLPNSLKDSVDELVERTTEVAEARALRFALGVAEDDKQLQKSTKCPQP